VAKLPRRSVSVSGPFFDRVEKWCRKHDVPISSVVEIVSARAIGMPLTELPETVRRWVHLVPKFARR
jgi:hypothetical protein